MANPEEALSDTVVGTRLRKARLARGMSLKAVEAALSREISATTLSAYERGEHAITVVRLCRLADLYGVPLEALVDPTGEDGPGPTSQSTGADVRLDLRRLQLASGQEVEVVARLVDAVQNRRRRNSMESMSLRREDLVTAAATVEQSLESFVDRLRDAGVLRRAPGRPPASPGRTRAL